MLLFEIRAIESVRAKRVRLDANDGRGAWSRVRIELSLGEVDEGGVRCGGGR